MNQPARTLMVGLGTRGKKWARILHEETKSQTVGYVDIDDANLEWAQTMYEAKPETCYNDMNQALKDLQPDFVVLATPPMDRYKHVMNVLESGAHLLSEKPLSLDFDEGIRMVKAAEDAKLGFAVGLNFRFQHSSPQGPRDSSQPKDWRAPFRRVLLLAQPRRLRALPEQVPADHASAHALRAGHPPHRLNPLRLRLRSGARYLPLLQPTLEHVPGRRDHHRHF